MRIKLITFLLLFTILFGGSKIANSEDAIVEPVDGLKLYEKRFDHGTKYYITEINLKKLDMHISLSDIKRNEPNYDTWQDIGSFHGRNPYFEAQRIHDFKLPSGETPIAISSGAFGGAWPENCDHCEGYLTFPARSNGLLVAEGYGDPGGRDPNRTLIKDDTSKCNVLCYDNYNGVADIYPWYHIKDGQRCNNEFVSFTEEVVPSTSTGGRTFCGVADRDGNSQNETILILTTSYASNEQVTQALRDLGATATIQFDGGGSSQLWVDGTDYVASSRPVWNTFVIGPKSFEPIIQIENFFISNNIVYADPNSSRQNPNFRASYKVINTGSQSIKIDKLDLKIHDGNNRPLFSMSDPNTGDSRYYENKILSQNESFQFEESGSYFNEGPTDPNKPLKYKVVARAQIDGQWYELGHHDISVVLFPNSSTIKTVRRVGNIAWYPSDKSCEEASEWYDLSKPPSSASQTVSICSQLQQELERISESANPSQEIPEDFFWQTWLKALLEILDFFGLKISAEKIMDFFIIQEISIPLASEASSITIISGSGLSPIDATGFGYELKPIELLPEPGLPDFVTTEVRLKTTNGKEKYVYDKDEQIQIHAWFENIGDADWAGSDDEMEVRFYLSSGYKEDSHSEWIRIGKETIQKAHLKLGDSPDHEEESLKLWEYPEIKNGNFYNIVACADRIADKDNGDGAIPEKHKSNNCSTEAVFFVKSQPLSHDWKSFLLSDANGDLRADVLQITPEEEKFDVRRSMESFFLNQNTWYDGPFDYYSHIFSFGDVTGDGLSDAVALAPSAERFIVWPSNGNGFGSGIEYFKGIFDYGAYEFRLADVNADNREDIIGIYPADERFVVWLSNGNSFISGVEWLNGPYDYSDYAFQLGDVNGDGKSDVIGLSPLNERFVVWPSSGSSFIAGVEWKYGYNNFKNYQFDISDVNGDGKDDIVGVYPGEESFYVWLSNGNGFADGVEWYNGPFDYTSYSFQLEDVNGDGKGDIVAYESAIDRFVVWLSAGSSFSGGVEWYYRTGVEWFNGPFDYSCCEFKLKDINGDKKSDIVSLSPSTERFVAWPSSGTSFQNGYQFYDGPFDYSGYVFYPADVDGDGDADILGMSPLHERFVVWLSNNGVFAGGGEWYDGPFNYSDYIFQPGDFNGDGKDDVLAIWPEEERFVVWLSNGSSFPFAAEWFYGIWDYSMTEFQVADVNADGYDDIVSIYPQGERFVVWTSNGSSFTCVGEWYKGPFDYSSHIFRVADVTGDGKADIVAMHADSERFIVWKSSGVSFLPGAEWYNGPYSYPNHIFEVSDVSGDGIADVVGINPADERFIVWLSDGKSFAADSRNVNYTEVLCDFNNDQNVTLADGIITLKVCAGLSPSLYNILNIENVTLPQDNKVGLEEAIYILQKCAGLK